MPKRAAADDDDDQKMADSSQQLFKRSKSEKSIQNLFDLHDDYLESIFKWLDLNDLMTMVRVCKRFEQPIRRIIDKQYAKDSLKITFDKYDLKFRNGKNLKVLVLHEMAKIMPFLRCFGSSLSKLNVKFDEKNSAQCLAIEECILKYCDGLKEVRLDHCRRGAFESINEPFQHIEVLSFHCGYLGHSISQFNKWFPKLRSLTISHAFVANKFCIEERMPSLEHIAVKIGLAAKKFSQGNIDNAISLNPQLRSYRMNNGCKPRDLRLVIKELKQLEKLEFWIHPENFAKGCSRPFKFEEVKELTLDIYDKGFGFMSLDIFEQDSSKKYRLDCRKLEQLEVRCYFLGKQYFNFARKNDLKKLTIFCQYDGPSINFLMECASDWPNLNEVTIHVESLSADDIVEFLGECKHLQRFNISDVRKDIMKLIQELNSKLTHEWKVVPMITKCCFDNFEHSIIRQ